MTWNLKTVLELASIGLFSVWGLWTEYRLRCSKAENAELNYDLDKDKNKDDVAAESDSDALDEFNKNISSNTH